jgi:hypothetical protein
MAKFGAHLLNHNERTTWIGNPIMLEVIWVSQGTVDNGVDADFNWKEVDAAIQLMKDRGATVGVHLTSNMGPATGGDSVSKFPTNIERYKAFIRGMVERYPYITWYSIENEAAMEGFWEDTQENYIRMFAIASEVIRSAKHPGQFILNDGISGSNLCITYAAYLESTGQDGWEFLVNTCQPMPAWLAKIGNRDRFVAYLNTPAGNEMVSWIEVESANANLFDVWQLHYYQNPDSLPEILEWFKQNYQGGKKLQIWEIGLLSSEIPDRAKQAAHISKQMTIAAAFGVEVVVVFCWTTAIEYALPGATGMVDFATKQYLPSGYAFMELKDRLSGKSSEVPYGYSFPGIRVLWAESSRTVWTPWLFVRVTNLVTMKQEVRILSAKIGPEPVLVESAF